MPAKHLNQQAIQKRRKEVARRYEQGESMADIAAALGVHKSTISRDLKLDGHIKREQSVLERWFGKGK
jgi:IS30 family transposase